MLSGAIILLASVVGSDPFPWVLTALNHVIVYFMTGFISDISFTWDHIIQ